MNKCLSWRKVLPLLGCSFLFVTPSVFAIDYDVNKTNVSLYGYAKLDVMYDSGDVKTGNSNGMGDSVNFSKIAVDGQPSTSGHSNLHANESRLGIRTTTPTEKGDLITNIEGDFFFGNLRLRQAYGSWNGITAGQTWSNFHTFLSTTPTLDFTGPAGRDAFLRQAQLRYSVGNFHVAIEDPSGAMSGNSFDGGYDAVTGGRSIAGTDVDRKDGLPDITLRYESLAGALRWASAAMIREVAFDDGAAKDSKIEWGAFVAASYALTPNTTLRGQITGGEGIGAYMKVNRAPSAYRTGNELETIFAWGERLALAMI